MEQRKPIFWGCFTQNSELQPATHRGCGPLCRALTTLSSTLLSAMTSMIKCQEQKIEKAKEKEKKLCKWATVWFFNCWEVSQMHAVKAYCCHNKCWLSFVICPLKLKTLVCWAKMAHSRVWPLLERSLLMEETRELWTMFAVSPFCIFSDLNYGRLTLGTSPDTLLVMPPPHHLTFLQLYIHTKQLLCTL